MGGKARKRVRNLVAVLVDQLDDKSSAFDGFDPAADAVWMAEVEQEAEYVWSAKARLAVFLSAMRHFRQRLQRKRRVLYRQIDEPGNLGQLDAELVRAVRSLRPKRLIVVQPGEVRQVDLLTRAARKASVPLEVRPDRSFLCSPEQFAEHMTGRKQPRLEFFYREMRRRAGVLLERDKPVGGRWSYDAQNRRSFGRGGPADVTPPLSFRPDAVTRGVIRTVNERFASHPGGLSRFDWPVTPRQARKALADFIEHRLGAFGPFQDAMWTGEPFLHHSRLSSAMNLKLLSPADAVAAAGEAYEQRAAPLNSVEGFIRQVLGWREYVRGIYCRHMPDYLHMNHFGADRPLPRFYWTGQTDAECLRQAICQTLEYGYAHHIQRLMVTGLFAMLAGVDPVEVHKWYLAAYVDAIEWGELPNTLGMSQYGDGGIMGSKPYAATGKYIDRMSDYCRRCRYDPARAVGEDACPFTTLYWDFLIRNTAALRRNPRMGLQLRNLDRLDRARRRAIRARARAVLDGLS
ncbi:MAG: cryptochrome/photolyase family protein [Planctomycetota bacterium]|jgi:deoxyribodipyrimidine photolyase-related protein